MKEPVEILIRLLAQGKEIKTSTGGILVMDKEGKIGWLCKMGDGDVCLVDDGISFNYLVDMAKKIGHDELWLQACSLSLKGLNPLNSNTL